MNADIITLKREIPCSDFLNGFVDIPRFSACCAQCGSYGAKWTCPPYDFDPMSVWLRYSSILLYEKKVIIPEEEQEKRRTPDELKRDYNALLKPVKAELLDELFMLEREYEGSMALSAGGCDLCEACTRKDGLPCRDPQHLRWSVESIGGDVLKASAELFGESILWAEEGRLPEHFIIMGALLKK